MGYEFVEVVWIDAVAAGGWVKQTELEKPSIVHTFGWLVADEPEYVVLAMAAGDPDDPDDDHGNTWTIPRIMILETYTLDVA